MPKKAEPVWDRVEDYVRTRGAERGDTYGWTRGRGASGWTAVILVAEDARVDSFPRTIGRVRIVLRHIPAPDLR